MKLFYFFRYKVTPGKDAEKLVKLKLCKDETRSISFSSTGKGFYYFFPNYFLPYLSTNLFIQLFLIILFSDVFCITTKKTLKSVDSNLGVINRTIHQIHESVLSHCIIII